MLLPDYQNQRNFFDKQAANWHFPDADRKVIVNILKTVHLSPDSIILDAGCGTGNLFPLIRELVPRGRAIACDMTEQMLAECQRRFPDLQIPLWLGFCEQLPLKNESLDLILNYCVFPHIRNREKALREFWRVLKPGGQYYIIHPNGREGTNNIHRQIGHPITDDVLPATKKIADELQTSGFELRQIIDRNDLFLIQSVKCR